MKTHQNHVSSTHATPPQMHSVNEMVPFKMIKAFKFGDEYMPQCQGNVEFVFLRSFFILTAKDGILFLN